MKYSKDGRVEFHEDTHRYILDGKDLTSVTSYISKFKTPFDADTVAEKYAKKRKMKKEEVITMWEEKGRKAAENGTFVHSIFEDYFHDRPITTDDDIPQCEVAVDFIENYFVNGRLEFVESEYIVYNDTLAGQIDAVVKAPNGYYLFDWKTSKEISRYNPWQMMTGPYNLYSDCNYYHFSLQMSIYRELMKEYDIKDCYVVHIGEKGYEIYLAEKMPLFINNGRG